MPRDVDTIEIQGPPIDEIQKRSSWLRRSCVSLIIFAISVLVLLSILIQIVVRPDTQTLDTLPPQTPAEIPIYDAKNVDKITFTPGDERGEAIEFLAYVPKVILSPIIIAIEEADEATGAETEHLWESFLRIIGTPVVDHRDVIRVEWSELQASPNFLAAYYRTSLTDAGFVETATNQPRLRFEHALGDAVILELRDNGNDADGTDYAILHIYLTSQ